MNTQAVHLDFVQACTYLGVSAETFAELRKYGFIMRAARGERQVYERTSLDITYYLLALGQLRGWSINTLAWYADLLFAAEIGRAILLPIQEGKPLKVKRPDNWLETPYAAALLEEFKAGADKTDAALLTPLRSLVAVALGEGQFWPKQDALEGSALYPIIRHFETTKQPIINQRTAIARDVGMNFIIMMYTYTTIAPPISEEFGRLVSSAQQTLKGIGAIPIDVPPDEQEAILKQPLIAVEKLYASKATEIHSLPESWDFNIGVLIAQKQTIALQMKLPIESEQDFIDNIIDLIRPYVGPYGARVVHLLYEKANNPPNWRNPVITVETNELLDRLGLTRTAQGYHHSKNRERLRDALNAAHNIEIVGEQTINENGQLTRRAFRRSVLSIIGASFDAHESQNLSTTELFQRGLPKTLQIRLNFYDGVRRPDGKLGNNYVLMPPLPPPQKLAKANHAATYELLKAYFLFRYRQTRMVSRTLSVVRQTALEKANITDKKPRQATTTLRKALDHLVADGVLEGYTDLPKLPNGTFEITLTEAVVIS